MGEPLLRVRDLSVSFRTERGVVHAVSSVSFDVPKGAAVGLVGDSGCGKSVVARAILRLLPEQAVIEAGQVLLGTEDIAKLPEPEMDALRGRRVSMVFQEPTTSLNPVYTVGGQIAEIVRLRRGLSRSEARVRAVELLGLVGIAAPEARLRAYPHQLSVGMRQRVLLAMALACEPELLVADEPIAALDAIVQAQMLALLRRLSDESGTGVLYVTHDARAAAELAQHVVVMSQGRIIEQGPAAGMFTRALPPRTRGSLDRAESAVPGPTPSDAPPDEGEIAFEGARRKALLRAEGVSKLFPVRSGLLGRPRFVRAVDSVSLHLHRGETLGLVGESGCGKSTLGRTLVRLVEPTYGRIVFDGRDLLSLDARALGKLRRRIQIILQDPGSSLDPKMTVRRIVGEPLRIHGIATSALDRQRRVEEMLARTGLEMDAQGRRPHELSCGQRQRVAVARTLAGSPELVVCDEAAGALDASSRAQIVDLLCSLQDELGIAYLFISHDLAIVRRVSHRVAVMYLGRIVETGPVAELFERSAHPYTRALLSAVPIRDPARRRLRIVLEGEPASPIDPPSGCAFHPRCPRAAKGVCDTDRPLLEEVQSGSGHIVACFFPEKT